MYGFSTVVDAPFDETKTRLLDALSTEGFGALMELDIKAVMKKKIDKDMLPYTIIGACNPGLASQAIEADPDIGLLLPCNVLVRENEDGRTTVAFMDPSAVLGLVGRDDVTKVGTDVKERMERVRDLLAS